MVVANTVWRIDSRCFDLFVPIVKHENGTHDPNEV
jgi:hypothetical protein